MMNWIKRHVGLTSEERLLFSCVLLLILLGLGAMLAKRGEPFRAATEGLPASNLD